MRWDISSLVQSVNLICAKTVYYSNRPKYFFFASTAESREKFLKLVLDRVSKFGWMKQLITILFFEIRSSGFVFLNLSIDHLLILNLWRILNQLLVVLGEK